MIPWRCCTMTAGTEARYQPNTGDSDKRDRAGCDFYLKADCLQKTGAFKLRVHTIRSPPQRRGEGAGRHRLLRRQPRPGVAYAARDMGIRATICIPEGAPLSKIEATRSYGANVVLVPGGTTMPTLRPCACGTSRADVHPPVQRLSGHGGPGDDRLEILEQLPDVDMIFVPIGGGGADRGPCLRGEEPEAGLPGHRRTGRRRAQHGGVAAGGKIITLSSVDTVADGIKVKTPGDPDVRDVPSVRRRGGDGQRGEIASAILTVLEKQKLVAEGAGAVGIAAAMYHKVNTEGRKVCALLSGGNVDVTLLERILTRVPANEGRTVSLATVLPDQPNALASFLEVVSLSGRQRAGIVESRAAQHTGGHWLVCGEL